MAKLMLKYPQISSKFNSYNTYIRGRERALDYAYDHGDASGKTKPLKLSKAVFIYSLVRNIAGETRVYTCARFKAQSLPFWD